MKHLANALNRLLVLALDPTKQGPCGHSGQSIALMLLPDQAYMLASEGRDHCLRISLTKPADNRLLSN